MHTQKSSRGESYLQSRTKRGLDKALSAGVIAPGWAMERLLRVYLKKVLDEGEPFYLDSRLGGGPDGTLTRKLRTMNNLAGPELVDPDDLLTINNPRIPTKWAGLIRRLRVDELPQIRAVWRGEMSFVGVRPVAQPFYEQIREQVGLGDRLKWDKLLLSPVVPAAMTSWATVRILEERASDLRDYAQLRVEYDLRYPEAASPGKDLEIFFKSIGRALVSVAQGTERVAIRSSQIEYVDQLGPALDASPMMLSESAE